MYTAIFLCAVLAACNAQFWGPVPSSYGIDAGSFGNQAGFANAAHQAQVGGAQRAGAQGSQGSQGSAGFGQGFQHADAQHQAARYDHDASILAASEYASAAANQASIHFGAAFGNGAAQGSQASQGSRAGAGQFGAAEAAARNQAGQVGGMQQAQQAARPFATNRLGFGGRMF